MKTAIILHGKPSKKSYYSERDSQSSSHWIPWIQNKLLQKDVLTQTPEWPRPYAPNYKDWLEVFKQFTIDKDTVLIGHSCGGGFLVRWLSENDVKVGKVILVAPSLDPIRTVNGFFDFKIGRDLAKKTKGLVIFASDNDVVSIKNSVKKLRDSIDGIDYREFHGYGHFCFNDMKTMEFPELLEEALKSK